MAIVTGGACIDERRCFTLTSSLQWNHDGIDDVYRTMKERGILQGLIKNFGRFDHRSKAACLVSGLALHDTSFPTDPRNDVGLVSAMQGGALQTCREYFTDYLDCGRTLGRGNLFVYTLPTSPLAETAICYGLGGPLLYMATCGEGPVVALEQAAAIIDGGEAAAMLAILGRRNEYYCFALERDRKGEDGLSVDVIAAALENGGGLSSEKIMGIGGSGK